MQLLVVDPHTHTIASTHAYSTILENAKAAAKRGNKTSWNNRPTLLPLKTHPMSYILETCMSWTGSFTV